MMLTWDEIRQSLAAARPGTVLRIRKPHVEHPRDGGLRISLGLPVGQRADWRHPRCRGLHVREYPGHYTAQVAQLSPRIPVDAHLTRGATAGALLGLLLGRTQETTVVGAMLGALLGLGSATHAESSK